MYTWRVVRLALIRIVPRMKGRRYISPWNFYNEQSYPLHQQSPIHGSKNPF